MDRPANLRFAWLPRGTDWAECVPDLLRRPGEGLRFGKAGVVTRPKASMNFSLFGLMGCHLRRTPTYSRSFLVRPRGPFLRPDLWAADAPRAAAVKAGRRPPPKAARSGL